MALSRSVRIGDRILEQFGLLWYLLPPAVTHTAFPSPFSFACVTAGYEYPFMLPIPETVFLSHLLYNRITSSALTAILTFCAEAYVAVVIPMTSPSSFSSTPPLLPEEIGAVNWIQSFPPSV